MYFNISPEPKESGQGNENRHPYLFEEARIRWKNKFVEFKVEKM